VESIISTPVVHRMYEELSGISADAREIADFAAEHPPARQTFESFGTEPGRVLRHTCRVFGPERIVLGGGISLVAGLLLGAAERELDDRTTKWRVSELSERAALIGAGVSWPHFYLTERKPPTREHSRVVEKP
jgi:predicted NBD/HSP70 family sugar kinase